MYLLRQIKSGGVVASFAILRNSCASNLRTSNVEHPYADGVTSIVSLGSAGSTPATGSNFDSLDNNKN